MPHSRVSNLSAGRIALGYAVIAILWIAFSDAVVTYFKLPPAVETIKGTVFVVVTASLLYFTIRRLVRAVQLTSRERDETAKLYRTVVEASNERISFLNGRLAAMLGRPAEELQGNRLQDFIEEPHLLAQRGAQQSETYECRLRRDSDRKPWVLISRHPVLNDGGEVVQLVCTVIDITERKRAEEALRERADLLNLTHDTVFVTDMEGVIRYWNRGAEEQYEWSAEQVVGKVVHDKLKTVFPAPLEQIKAEVTRAGRWEGELLHTKKDGTQLVVASRWALQRDEQGAPLAILETNNDITERKQAEEELRESETRFRTIVDHAADAFFVHDQEHKVLDVNRQACESLGYTPEELIGMHPVDFDPYMDAGLLQRIRERLEAGEVFSFETRHRRKDGTMFPVEVRLRSFSRSGRRLHLALVRDITERKKAEEERLANLRFFESMDRINRAMQGANDLEKVMSDVLDALLLIFDCDRAWLAYPCDPEAPSWRPVMERTRPEFPGAFALGATLPVDHEIAVVFAAARASGGALLVGPAYDLKVPAGVAERFSVRSYIAMAVYPKVDQPYLFGLHQCRSAREWTSHEQRLFEEVGRRLADSLTSLLIFRSLHEREQALGRSEAYLAEAQRLSHTGSWASQSGGGLNWSEENFRIWGFDPQQGPPTREMVLQRIHPEDRDRVSESVEEALRERRDGIDEFRIVLPDGMVKHIHAVGRHVFNASGEPVEFVGTHVDVTERKRADEVLRKAQADLAHVTRVVTMGELVASIAHEVNQPLTGVVAHAGTCLRWLAAQPPDLEEARQALGFIVRDGKRAGEVISRLRALVKKAPPRRDRLDINKTILEVIALTHSELQRNHVELRTHLSSDLPLVAADRVQLQQVILNLIVNAMEAMSGVGDRPRELLVVTGASDLNEVFVEVRDSGPGLDSANLNRLFDEYYTTKQEGMGMGLSISRSIIEAHGGRLWATPNQPHGAVFRFTLPTEDDGTS